MIHLFLTAMILAAPQTRADESLGPAVFDSIANIKKTTEHQKAFDIINETAESIEPVAGLEPFTTDGCSVVKEEWFLRLREETQRCCFYHDLAYWVGGSENDRKVADVKLRQCLQAKGLTAATAYIFFWSVRGGGRPNTGKSYQWGYGWEENPGYKSRTEIYREDLQLSSFVMTELDRSISEVPDVPADDERVESLYKEILE